MAISGAFCVIRGSIDGIPIDSQFADVLGVLDRIVLGIEIRANQITPRVQRDAPTDFPGRLLDTNVVIHKPSVDLQHFNLLRRPTGQSFLKGNRPAIVEFNFFHLSQYIAEPERFRARNVKNNGPELIPPLEGTTAVKFTAERPYADPDKAARKLVEIANTIEAIQDGRIHIEKINAPFLAAGGSPAEYGAGLDIAIARGWLWKHDSGTFVKFTQTGADLFA